MIKIIGIVGSPRLHGNTEYLVKEALDEAMKEGGVETEVIRLAEKTIKPCTGCYSCLKTGKCFIEDGFEFVFKKMVEADGIILASPVYVGSATPQIKSLIDRTCYITSYSKHAPRQLENKVGGPIVVARRAGQNFTLAQLLFFFLQQGMIVPGSTYWNMAFGRNKGEVKEDEEVSRLQETLVKKWFGF